MKLGVNVDHVATLRQARGGKNPDPVEAAKICEKAGAHAVVMHLREDRRHVQDADVFRVKDALSVKFNLEMSVAPSIVKVALRLRPGQVTFVPEKRQEKTTEGGLDLFKKRNELRRVVGCFREKGILVSLFIDPDLRQLEEAARLGADAVEFHTGDYANQTTRQGAEREWARLRKAVGQANKMGITAHAGHGLDYANVRRITKIKGLEELNIGYAIITRALWVGLERAVTGMRELVE